MNTTIKRALFGASLAATGLAALAQPSGQWDFNSGSLAATVGQPLTYVGGAQTGTSFNTTTAFGIPNIGAEVAQVLKTSAYAVGDALGMPTPSTANGGGSYVNDYTLIMDVLVPAESNSKPRAILDPDLGAINPDAEFFINADNTVGAKGLSAGTIPTNTWNRIAFVVDADNDPSVFSGTVRVYINGVEVGSRRVGNLKDDRFALAPGSVANLFSDDTGETAPLYINSIQLRPEALSKGQMLALGGATAAGIPQTLPPVPSGIEAWIPRGSMASRNTRVGAVISTGSTTIQDSSIGLSLNGAVQANPTITRAGELITVATAPLTLTPGNKYTNVVTFTDSLNGARSFTSVFTAALFFEDFESIVLGPGLEENHAADIGWTNAPPTGWTVNNTNMAGFNSPDDDGDGRRDGDGRSEWFGWAFANKDWWVRADDQRRSEFSFASGTVAIADPDEWDDGPHDPGLFNSIMTTPPISLQGVNANAAFVSFASSWRPEGKDDGAPNFPVDANDQPINNQTAIVMASFDGAAPVQVLKWDSVSGSPTFHTDLPNESVLVPLKNPAGAQNVVLSFHLVEAANDWWWAVDNISVTASASPPTITVHPAGGHYSVGGKATMSVTATGTEPFTYQWKREGQNIAGATGQTLTIDYLEANAGGNYTVAVSNAAATVESNPAKIELYSGTLTNNLVAHLKFDQNLTDSAKDNDGAAVGSPAFIAGKIGSAVHITTGADYVTMGTPTDLNFGTSTDFSISFWAQVNGLSGDPSIIGNKDWDSGSNPGYVLFSASNRRIAWNLAGPPGGRKDSDAVANTFTNDTWKHVVATFDRDGNAIIFVDGAPVRTVSLAATQNNLDTPEGFATNLGQDGAGDYGSFFTDLRLDDLGIWRRVLTAQEIQAIFAAGNASKDLAQASFTAPSSTVTGQWDFNSGNLAATVGQPLTYRGDIQSGTTFSTMTVNGAPAQVMGFPAATVEQGYIMPHGAAANGGGAFVNEYTLIMDVMFPTDSTGKWRGLLQTSEANANDGELFVNTGNGIGISGNYPGQILANTWHRIAFVFDLPKSTLAKYIDGVLVGSQAVSPIDGRFALGTTALLFTDEDGETAPGFVNSIQIRQGTMRASEIAALGGATAAGIPAAGTPPAQIRTSIALSGANVVIGVNTPGTYQLQRRDSLNAGAWANDGAPSNSGSFTIANAGRMGFFRVVQTAP